MSVKDDILKQVSANLGIDPSWLNNLIEFESGWNPAARNELSGARGLIQFTHTTARNLGFQDADDLVAKYPDAEGQLLSPVYRYLSKMKPYPTKQSLYMAVFYPAARNWAPDTAFSPTIQKLNPGIVTVADYVRKVEIIPMVKTAAIVAIILIAGILLIKPLSKELSWHNQTKIMRTT
jgi:hypothetical protein